QTVLQAGTDQPLSVKADLLVQMLQALMYLHRHGILHRDLKPENALVSGGQVRVLDCGLAAARDDVENPDDMVVGTLTYMAPELFSGVLPGEASDLYAVGLIAYELLAGFYPFE